MSDLHPDATLEAAPHPALRPHPSKLFVEVTTRCNLRCAMCAKEAPGQRIAEGDMSRETFARLAPALPRLDALVLSGMGEPLLHPELAPFVEEARRVMPASGWIGFQTNGQLLCRETARALADAGVDRICISADAVSPDMFRALRAGGEREKIEAAAAALHDAALRRGRPISLGVEFVAMRDNLRQLPELVRFAARNRFSFVIVSHMLAYGEGMAGAAAFEPFTDRTLEVHREWRRRAAADGVDLSRYLEAFMTAEFATAEDQRIMSYGYRMIEQASKENVWISAKLLVPREDEELAGRVEEAFGEAAEIARREGVELRLPAVGPKRARRCDFVEDGSAFVSWDGDLHPCHFLWHRYGCHVGGIPKHVKPWSFGNVADRDVLALWNGAAARAFREEVLRYDQPFCYDCTVALCRYQEDEDFTHDCQLNTVPCGACLWSTGVFQCLG
jgi:putative metalloenzyme radical SAM/SPASM domain maturase